MVPTVHLWQSHTQRTLEKVLKSRLVETFITIDIPSSPKQSAPSPKSSTQASHPSSHDRWPSPRASPSSKSKLHSPKHSPSRSSLGSREEQITKRHSRTGTATSTDSLTSTPTSPNRRGVTGPTKPNGNASKSAPQVKADPETRPAPNFISAIHKPSTNPCFALDIDDFSKWTDPSATNVTVQLWAKLRPDLPSVLDNDREKERASDDVDTCESQWRMAGKWDICLDDLVPLPDEVSFFNLGESFSKNREPQVSAQPSSLPSNTLLLTLSPSGETFYLSVPRSSGPTRSPSPSSGYNTDPEGHTSGKFLTTRSTFPRREDISLPRSKVHQSRTEYAASSTWADLAK